jgi:phosphohistidine phosphatase
MNLLIIRHAIAMEREDFHKTNTDDEQRPLILEGIKKMRKNVIGLRRVVPYIKVMYSSPLVRAEQTAKIVADEYEEIPVEICKHLKPESDPADLLEVVKEAAKKFSNAEKETSVLAVVGHEPHLSELIGYLVTGKRAPLFELRKGGACLINFESDIAAGKGQLEWVLKPSIMRKLVRM